MALSAKELQSGKGRHVMYTVTVTTSNESVKCGTDCAVYLTIHGANGHTAVHSLRPLALVSSKIFSHGAVDKFSVQDIDVRPFFLRPFLICHCHCHRHLRVTTHPHALQFEQVGALQRITLSLAQDGSALEWKPCQVRSLFLPLHLRRQCHFSVSLNTPRCSHLFTQVRVSRPRVSGALAITPEVAQFEIDRRVLQSCHLTLAVANHRELERALRSGGRSVTRMSQVDGTGTRTRNFEVDMRAALSQQQSRQDEGR